MNDRVAGPMSARHIEFSGLSYAEMFRRAADWFAAHDGEITDIIGLGTHLIEATKYEPETWYTLHVFYDED